MQESVCRLCLQILIKDISCDIFPQNYEGLHENVIPMRLAAVAAIEVSKFDSLPKRICQTCRYHLELSYSFRKKSQIADAKLRKHFKLLSLGRSSNLLQSEDDDQDEILEDSQKFVEEFERKRIENLRSQIRLELEVEAQARLEELSSNLRLQIAEEIREEVRQNERFEIEQNAKENFEKEIIEKCRKEETKAILKDLEEFLKTKQTERNNPCTILNGTEIRNKDSLVQINSIDLENDDQSQSGCLLLTNVNKRKDNLINTQVQTTRKSSSDVMSYEIRINNKMQSDGSDDAMENIEEVAVFNCAETEDESSKDQCDDLEILKVINYESGDDDKEKDSNDISTTTTTVASQKQEVQTLNNSTMITYICVDSSNVTSHGRSTTTPKVFKCKLCPVEVSTKNSLQRHSRVHENNEKSVTCPECKIVVSCSSALKRHMYVHSGEKPFVCNICNKAFGQREILKRHENTQHKGLRRHKCTYCEKKFSQKINLTQHIEQHHLGEPRRIHKCHLCTKSFFFSSGLSRHLSFHSGLTYQCTECERTFTDRSSVKRHLSKVHGIEKDIRKILNEDEPKST